MLRPAPAAGNADRAIASMHRALASIGWDEPGERSCPTVAVDFDATDSPVDEAVMAIEPQAECFIATFNFGAAPPDTRGEVMRFATRANWELPAGNFELDLETGAVRLRSSVAFTGAELPESTIRSVVGAAIGVVEAYADALRDVMEGRAVADEALGRMWQHPAKETQDG